MESIETKPVDLPPQYGDFWSRGLAAFIDGIVVNVGYYAVFLPISLMLRYGGEPESTTFEVFGLILSFAMTWLYEAIAVSSQWQATVGKTALGLIVTDLEGNRLSFVDATGRYIAKILSAILLMIGYLIQPFTAKRQALHDILAGTLVVKK